MIPTEIRETIKDALHAVKSDIALDVKDWGDKRDAIDRLDAAIAWLDAQPQPFVFDWDAIPPDYDWAVVETYEPEHCYQVHAHLFEPQWDKRYGWVSDGDYEHVYLVPDLPLGLDYRTLKAKRPSGEATE